MQILQRRGTGFHGIITSLAKEKLKNGEGCIQRCLHEHLLSEGHNGFINEVKIISIDKTDPSDPSRREAFWRTKLKTLAPTGLNVE